MLLRRGFLIISALLAVVLAGCHDDDDDNSSASPIGKGELRLTHAVSDAPTVDIYLNGAVAATGVDFGESSGVLPMDEGVYSVEVKANLPGGAQLVVIPEVDVMVSDDMRTDVAVIGAASNGSVEALVIEKDIPDTGDVSLTLVHAAPAAPQVDVFLSEVSADLAALSPTATVSYKDFGNFSGLPADMYQARITAANDAELNVLYDSDALNFPAGTDLLILAVPNVTGIGAAPVNLLVINESSGAFVLDKNIGAEVRVVHNVADAPAVNILVDGTAVLEGVEYPNSADFDAVAAPGGDYTVSVAVAETGNEVISASLSLSDGVSYTAIANGSVVGSDLALFALTDNRRAVATEARLRVAHLSFEKREVPVDVYLTATETTADENAAIEDLAFREATDEIPVAGGNYFVTVTAADDQSLVVFGPAEVSLEAGTQYTVLARDPASHETAENEGILVTILRDPAATPAQ